MDFNIHEPYEDEEPLPPPRGQRLAYRIGIVVVILGLLYLYGFYNGFLFQRTGQQVIQEPVGTLDAERLTVPLRALVLTGTDSQSSRRTRQDVARLVANTDIIWEQAALDVVLERVEFVSLSDADIRTVLEAPRVEVPARFGAFDGITVLLPRTLGGINGIAFVGSDIVAVADFTTVFDFRTLAHEIGHILGLVHIPADRSRLMFQGANGTALSEEEVALARERAVRFQ